MIFYIVKLINSKLKFYLIAKLRRNNKFLIYLEEFFFRFDRFNDRENNAIKDLFVVVFISANSTWSQPMQMNLGVPSARAAHGMCAVGKSLVIFGGKGHGGATK